jgi:uncharacterized protein YjbJ (UPF0337 family)
MRCDAGISSIPDNEGESMTAENKVKNAADSAKGAAKDLAGRIKDDKSLEAEGKKDRAKADLKQAGEKVKDAFKH